MNSVMSVNGLSVELNLPDAPSGDGIHGLPPYCKQDVYVVEEYPDCPTNWMHGSAKASSYFIKVKSGKHLWLDFNTNWKHSHHVAVVLSVQGINPITGQKITALRLEQYRNQCPEHKIDFKQDRYCEQCNFKWPSQNYLTTVTTPHNQLWIDGWRTQDRKIRGFLITEETARGIASQLIGDDRVFAIGIAFYLSKEPKPITKINNVLISQSFGFSGQKQYMLPYNEVSKGSGYLSCNVPSNPSASYSQEQFESPISCDSASDDEPMLLSASSASTIRGRSMKRMKLTNPIEFPELTEVDLETETDTKLEIGGGVQIEQELSYLDPNELSFYQDEPIGLIYVNYCSENQFNKIINAGKKDLTNKGEGKLAGLMVGN